jgi:RNA polymerase sigma-70 factor, ECF subfamily
VIAFGEHFTTLHFVSLRTEYIEEIAFEGAKRLLARAADARSLQASALAPRITKTVQKYLLRDDEHASADAITAFIDDLQADDLCLAIACENGDQSAWEDLVARFSVTVRSAARSVTANEDASEDLAQSIWAELHGLREREDGKPASKLSYYSGRGSLAGWLRAVVAQLAVDQHRKQARLIQPEEAADMERLARDMDGRSEVHVLVGAADPEQAVTHKVAGQEIQTALASAIKELADEDRLLVKLYYFDELRLREAGAVLGVHEATASRRLTRIHNDLRSRVLRTLVDDHGWTKPEAERAFAEMAVHLEMDLESLLASGSVAKDRARSST